MGDASGKERGLEDRAVSGQYPTQWKTKKDGTEWRHRNGAALPPGASLYLHIQADPAHRAGWTDNVCTENENAASSPASRPACVFCTYK